MSIPMEGSCEARFAEVRATFERCLEKNREVGAAIAFSLNGEMVVDLWGGHVDRETAHPWQRDTLVNTYSTTKGMTAICVHQLIERGEVDLDAPVAEYWPEFAQAGKESIPVRWLLTHHAGLPAIAKPLPEETLFDWDAMTTALAEQAPWWEPGTERAYHPITFGHLVGEVVRRVSGQSLGNFFREQVAEPLDADFHIGLTEKDEPRVADILGSVVVPPGKIQARENSAETPVARIKGPLGDYLRDMGDPTTMVGAAFNNPRQYRSTVNSREWRRAEIPAANGHGTARALARIYGTLACGGEAQGVRVLEKASIDLARSEQVSGPDRMLGGASARTGLGYMLRSDTMPFSPSDQAFGHPGAGGSLGMADPDAGVGFGYVMNRIRPGLMGGRTAYAVIRAFFDAL